LRDTFESSRENVSEVHRNTKCVEGRGIGQNQGNDLMEWSEAHGIVAKLQTDVREFGVFREILGADG
jgi:hypothetical protein